MCTSTKRGVVWWQRGGAGEESDAPCILGRPAGEAGPHPARLQSRSDTAGGSEGGG